MRVYLFLLVVFFSHIINAQTLGGNAVFSFLKLPNSAQQSALGGINISSFNKDVGNSWANPALLNRHMHKQLHTSYNSFLAGINQLGLLTAFGTKNEKLHVGTGLQYVGYGSILQTDAAGNTIGTFKASDYALQIISAYDYNEYFRLGVAAKFVQSAYGQFRASGFGLDIGLLYRDTIKGLQASVLVKNIGTQLTTYEINGSKEEFPFDLQAGISYLFNAVPLELSLTTHQISSQFILGAQYKVGDYIELNAGYNFLRGRDLNITSTPNAFNGFSAGFGLLFKKFTTQYGTGFYQKNMFHHFSVNLVL
jgi:hypothetical protein